MTIPQMDAPDTFLRCQLCGFASPDDYDDICAFRMWQRCDEADNPIADYLITCKQDSCFEVIDADPMLFREVEWSRGGPGRFMLLCGDCPSREGFACKHPNLKSNGGSGLLVNFAHTPISGVRVCMADGSSFQFGLPANRCEGHPDPDNKPTVMATQ